MTPLRPGIRRLLRLTTRTPEDSRLEVDEEVAFHLDLLTERLKNEGLEPAAARAEAERRFWSSRRLRDDLYQAAQERDQEHRGRERWESFWQDLRYAARTLRREPMTTTFIVLTIALGLGANLLGFGFADQVLLRGPALVPASDQIIRVFQHTEGPPFGAQTSPWIPYQSFTHLAEDLTTVSRVGAYRQNIVAAGVGDERRSMRVVRTLGAYFPVLGVAPLRGRFFTPDEDASRSGNLAIVSAGVWRGDFASAPEIVGRHIVIDGEEHTIVGVAPEGFAGADRARVDLWALGNVPTAHTTNWWVIGRLKPGSTTASAGAEADAIHRRTGRDGPEWTWNARMSAGSLLLGRSGKLSIETVMAGWLGGISVIVLLIACANVINLLLARLARRHRDLAVRVALGAGRARVGRLLILEGSLLALLSAVVAALFLAVAEPSVRRWIFPDDNWKLSLIDPRLLLILVGGTAVVAVLFGVIPAFRAGQLPVASALRSGRETGRLQTRLRAVLTAGQAALSVLLLIGAGLFVRSQLRVNAVDLGVDARRVQSPDLRIRLAPGNNTAAAQREFFRRLVEIVRAVPGVEQASFAVAGPLTGSGYSTALRVPGLDSVPVYPGGGPYLTAVGPDYFTTMGTRILQGRGLLATDREGTEPVLVVSATMARALWPDGAPLDKCVHIGEPGSPCARVVGVAADVHRNGFKEETALQYYVPAGQERGVSGGDLLIRSAGDPERVFPAIRAALLTDPAVETVDPRLLSDPLDQETRPLRLGMTAFGLSGGLAVIVALLGLYSLLSYMVAWRTHEIGVRIALGAGRLGVVVLVVRSAAGMALTGIAIGSLLAFAGARQLEPFLFQTDARDPLVYGVVALLLLGVALLAGCLPASKATRISPMEALRAE